MKNIRYLLLALIVIGASALIFALVRPEAEATEGDAVAQHVPTQPAPMETPTPDASVASNLAASKSTAQWIADTASGDAATRAAAITALAEAPRTEALPVLSQILESGEPKVDRPLALISLRDIALNQGDADGAVRDAIRHVIYHGDDFTRVDDAQEALDVIEESLQLQ